MVLVDTSIWIDFFQAPESRTATELVSLIKDHNRVVLCGIVLQELLQGIRDKKSFELVRERLRKFPFIETKREDWIVAASLYKELRAKGITLPPADVTIAATALHNNITLFSRDGNFGVLAESYGLKLYVM